jgi:cellulose synthase operon protein C
MKTEFKQIITLGLLISSTAFSAAESTKGLLPEVKLNSENEDTNQQTAFKSEVLITKAENKAIESLVNIIKKKKGAADEADLNYRLAELYMRRAKSGRFFDMNDKADSKLNKLGVQNQKSVESLKNAITIYNKIEKEFPKYNDMAAVLFNSALAHLQTKQTERSKELYDKLITEHPKSNLMPDALLEVGEIYYNQQNFATALEKFQKIDAYPKSKAYPYGLYKSAWCLYNLKQTDAGVQKLLIVVRNNPADSTDQKKFNLRKEALRDLTLFVGESVPPQELFGFFSRITTENELGEVIMNLANLYESHSRFKEISIFVKEFIDKYPQNINAAKSYSKLIETNETLKQRDVVISYMKKMGEFCKAEINAECKTEFRKVSLEISKKWWDIWLKNKKHNEFSKLTEQAFEILLSQEDKAAPDSMSRYAYAELLFQQEKYELAGHNYEEVSLNKSLDKTKAHDALYGALFSLEKQMASLQTKDQKSEDPLLVEKQKNLAIRYITEFKNGEHFESLQFKLGFIAYKQQDYDLSLKALTPFAASAKNKDLKSKAEDIILDIYNIKKDYLNIQKFADIAAAKTTDETRKKSLNQMVEEANYSQIQTDSATLDAQKRINLLKQFSGKHKNSKLSQDALWQSISLAYSNGFEVQGADLSQTYASQFPQDKRNLDATKEALKAYIEAGQLKKAVTTTRELAKLEPAKGIAHLELSCDLLRVNSQLPEARGCYKALFDQADKNKKTDLLSKLMKSFGDKKNLAELQSIENQIVKDNIEPYVTQILIDKAKKLLADQKYSEAFNLSLKANSRPVDADIRAEARLIQAQVLEKEFVSQSVKARESKFAAVLSMKTEKLDKAFTAYSTSIKMSKSDRIQAQGLQGIDRLYVHFIEAVSNMPIPESLAVAEQKTLRDELIKMTLPFQDKRKENLLKLRSVSKLSTADSEQVNWADLNIEKTIEPRVKFPSVQKLTNYLPDQFSATTSDIKRLPSSEKKCEPAKVSANSIGGCIQAKKFNDAEKMAYALTETKEQRALGLYYLSVIADQQNELDKSLWMIEKALTADTENSLYNYQKGKVLYSVEGINTALPFFEKILDMKKNSNEIRVMNALKSFSDRDYLTASDEFSRLSTEDLYNYSVAEIYIESVAQKGETEQAVALSQKLVNFSQANVDTYLEQARIMEQFALNKVSAIEVYKKAITRSPSSEQKDWIKRKIEFLKTNKIGAL